MNPPISVLMPVYNCEEYVGVAIQSILNQTVQDFEFIIIDDASTDGTKKIVESFHDPRIVLISKEKNTGYTNSLNMGLKLAKGKYIARMDGDDISFPERFEKQIDYLEKNTETFLCGTWTASLEDRHVSKLPEGHEDIGIAFLEINPFAHSSVMFKRQSVIDYKLYYKIELEPAEDYELWTRFYNVGRVHNIPEVLVLYRQHEGQVSELRKETQESNAQKIREHFFEPLYEKWPIQSQRRFFIDFQMNNQIDDSAFYEACKELDFLRRSNSELLLLDQIKFTKFCEKKKKSLLENYFLNTKERSVKKLLRFLSPKKQYFHYFKNKEKGKIFFRLIFGY